MQPADDVARHARASELFLALRGLPPSERESALERAAPEDEALRAEVLSLWRHDVPDGAGQGELELPERIGPYRVVRCIGRGGSGQVFLAEQEEPVRRSVAIKIVPAAAHSPELAARLYVERRALERAEHPHVARILDAGRTEAGLPYLVMEYVEGLPITTYCERAGLSLGERVRLALGVVDAVQHAHQRGVVHRDLKPANVLVAEVGGKASPRVLDFGIAKPIEGAFGEDSPATLGLPLGTPAYMAPEQTGLAQVDTRADVYALGALVYELAAGRPPIDTAGDPLEVLRRIREQRPEPASRARARDPQLAGPRPSRALAADLDVVLAKALEKDPARRYSTAAALAADLERALAREPIEARPATAAYRLARFAERNRALAAAALLALAALVVGVVGLALGLREAQRQKAQAEQHGDALYAINRFLTDDILLAASPDRAGPEATALDLLRRASPLVEARLPGRPLTAAAVHQALGSAFAELGSFDEAEHHVERALLLRRAAAGSESPDAVRSEISAASLGVRRQLFAEAEPALVAALARARLLLGPDDRDLYTAMNDLGVALISLGRAKEAMPLFEEALAGRARLLEPTDRDVLAALSNLGFCAGETGDVERSLELFREALLRMEAMSDPPQFTLLGLNNNVGATLQDLGRDEEALPYLRRAAEVAEQTIGPEHPDTLTIQGNLAGLEADLGNPEQAILLFERVVAKNEALLGPAAESSLTTRHGLCSAVKKAGRSNEAAVGFTALLADVDEALGRRHPLSAQTAVSLATLLFETGRPAEALPHAEHAAASLLEIYGPDHYRAADAARLLAKVQGELGR